MLRRLLARLALAVGSALLAALVAELVLCTLGPDRDALYVWPPGLERAFHPAEGLMPGVEGTSRFRINEVGLRGDPWSPASTERILCVGGSTTECLYLDQPEAWPQLLQDHLGPGTWVANAGHSGRHSRDHVVQLRHFLTRPPGDALGLDRVVILEGVNDLMLPLTEPRDYDPGFLARDDAEAQLLPRAFEVLPADLAPPRPFPKGTCLYRFAIPRLRAALEPVQVQDEAGSVYRTWRAHRADPGRLITELPDLTAALGEYRRNLTEMVELCLAADLRPLLLTQPALWRTDNTPEEEALFWMGGVGPYQKRPGQPYYDSAVLARGMEAYNRVTMEVATALDVDALDLAARIPRTRACFYDDVHFTEEGARRVAEALAEALR